MIYFLMLAVSVTLLPQKHVEYELLKYRSGVLAISRTQIRNFLAFLVVFLVAALRYGIGTDYFYTYVPGFIALRDHPSSYDYYEPAFRLLNLICIAFTDNYQSIFVATSLIVYGVLFYTICRWSSAPRISLMIYFGSSLFFSSLSNMRQAISMVICYMALERLLDKRNHVDINKLPSNKQKYTHIWPLIEFYALVGISFLFHSSSIIFAVIPLLFAVKRVRLQNHIIIASLAAIVVVSLNYSGFANRILDLTLTFLQRYTVYNYIRGVGGIFWSFLLYNIAVYFLMYIATLSSKTSEKQIERSNIYMNVQMLAIIVLMFSNIIPTAERVAKYFILCQCASVPFFIKNISTTKTKTILSGSFLLLYTAWILFYIFSYGADECFPYQCVLFVKDAFQKRYFGF